MEVRYSTKFNMLFDDKVRTDSSPRKNSETLYNFLCRTSTERYELVRRDINSMLSSYPDGLSKGRLIKDFSSDFEAAFFELFLHNLLKEKGYEVIPEPSFPNSKSAPDFLAKKNEIEFISEAKVIKNSEPLQSSFGINERIAEYIDNNVSSDHFFLSINSISNDEGLKLSELVKFLKKALEDEIKNYELMKESQESKVITYRSKANDICIEFDIIPKSSPKTGQRVVGGRGMVFSWTNHYQRLRAALKDKITKYQPLGKKLVIAINDLTGSDLDNIDKAQALYGQENYLPIPGTGKFDITRKPNGLWSDDRYIHNSCILFFDRICIDNYRDSTPIIRHHPLEQNQLFKNLF